MTHPNEQCHDCMHGCAGHKTFCRWRSMGSHVGTIEGVHIREVLSVEDLSPLDSPLGLLRQVAVHHSTSLAPFPVLSLSPSDYAWLQRQVTAKNLRAPTATAAPAQSSASVRCSDCNGTGQYVGLGWAPAEACRKCGGAGRVNAGPAPALLSSAPWNEPQKIRPIEQPAQFPPPTQAQPHVLPVAPNVSVPAPPGWPPSVPWPFALADLTREVAEQAAALKHERMLLRRSENSVSGVMTLPDGSEVGVTVDVASLWAGRPLIVRLF